MGARQGRPLGLEHLGERRQAALRFVMLLVPSSDGVGLLSRPLLLVAMPGAPSSVLAPSSKARSP